MKRVLITGASRGIGLELVRQYAVRGDRVFAAARRPEGAEELARIAAGSGGRVELVTLDTADEASIDAAFEAVRARTDALDVLINNAGIGHGGAEFADSEKFGSVRMDAAMEVFRVNVAGPLLVSQRFLPLLRAAGGGAVLAGVSSGLGSIAAREGSGAFAISYSASKAALDMVMRALAFDPVAEGVITVALDPGWVRTDMGGANATLDVKDSAAGMIRVLDGLTPERTGRFLAWDGSEKQW